MGYSHILAIPVCAAGKGMVFKPFSLVYCPVIKENWSSIGSPGGGGELPYITDGDARQNFQKQPLKVTILGVAPANFIP